MAKDKKKDKKKILADETIAVNKRGRFDYEIEETIEAGLVLTGTEVKSARTSQVQLAESFARLESGPNETPEVWLHNSHFAPYGPGAAWATDPRRKRKLLLKREQINRLIGRVQQKGYTLVPLKLYFTGGRAKLELGVGKGRKTHDKRRSIQDREIKRDAQKQLSER
jgi:SsrA-binding protein